ncbi:uncharacterized protein LOC127804468 [Diospyros lotus]|uniref:uncharacterized protein LOC127804468 n=1 Tax=Diospyros lotus TaxID=55363 RepID=UPI00224CF83F|nr:uncharacterized protein LOC127804468 [Diospyros lotus]
MGKNQGQYCRYHRTRGHSTDHCRELKNQIEMLIYEGHLQRYVRNEEEENREPRQSGDRRDGHERPNPGQQERGGDRRQDIHVDNEPTQQAIHVISGGETLGGDTSASRKPYARQAYQVNSVMEMKKVSSPLYSFTGEAVPVAGSIELLITLDESRDISIKEQMSTVLRYANKMGHVVERFIGVEHVSTVAKKHVQVTWLFNLVSRVVNIVGASSKRCDLLREKQEAVIFEALHNGEISSGRCLNQQSTITHFGDTRWGSHYGTLISLISMFLPIVDVLEMIVVEGSTEQKCEADDFLDSIQSFEFAFNLHLMRTILTISNELFKALQRKDQDIVNAITLVKICKQRLQVMRDNEWDLFLKAVVSFCEKYNIDGPDMDGVFICRGRSRRNTEEMTNLHHFRVDLFYAIIDMQLQELNDHFYEVSTELLLCIECLCPNDSFSAFDKEKLIRLAEYYREDFSRVELMAVDDQLQTYIFDIRSNKEFEELGGLGEPGQKLVAMKNNIVYPLVYKLVTLALTFSISTATVERVFSTMNIMKNRLRSRIGDQWMNDSLVVYVEKDVFNKIDNEVIMRRYQSMKSRKQQL